MGGKVGHKRPRQRRDVDIEAQRERLADDRPAWDRQPHESDHAYAAFLEFRDAGLPRPAVQELYDARPRKHARQTWYIWSSKFAWAARAQAWEAHVAQPMQDAVAAELVREPVARASEIAQRQLEHASKLHAVASNELDKLVRLSRESDEITVTPKTLMALITLALQLERALTPEDGIEDAGGGVDYSQLDTDDLVRLRGIAQKLRSGGE